MNPRIFYCLKFWKFHVEKRVGEKKGYEFDECFSCERYYNK